MAELNPPWTLQNLATHNANVNRAFLALLAGGAEGVLATSGIGTMAVTQRAAGANMSVDVAAGICVVFGDENNVQGLYGCANDATKNVVIAAADATNPRRDLIVARVRDAFYSGATNAWALEVVQGTPAASPSDPAMPNNAICLARVTVGAAVSSIVTGNIADLRPFAPLGILPVNSARRPGVLYGPLSQEPAFKSLPNPAQLAVDLDTWALRQYTTPTTGWQLPWALPWGRLTHQIDTGTGNIALGPSGEGVRMTSAAVTIPANRIIRVTGYVRLEGSNAFYTTVRIRRGTTIGGTLIGRELMVVPDGGFGAQTAAFCAGIDIGANGSTQYVFTSDAGDVKNPSHLMVEDLGPNGAPA